MGQEFAVGIELLAAENGFAGLLMAGRHAPDLIIVDLMMPEMDGFRLIEELQASAHGPWSIVVITALGRDEIAAKGSLPSEITILNKPVSYGDMRQLFQFAIEIRITVALRRSGLGRDTAPIAAKAAPT